MKPPVVDGTSVIRVPFGSPLTGPVKRFIEDLENVSYECDRCRNAMLRHWIRWHEDHPNYQPKPKPDGEGGFKKNKKGEILLEDRYFPHVIESSTSKESLYRKGKEVCPTLAAKIISSIQREVIGKLKIKMPYNHNGKAKIRAEAILTNEVSPDNNSGRNIPSPCQDTTIAYEGKFSNDNVDELTQHYGKSDCILRFALFSKQSGRKFNNQICHLDISKFTPGQKDVLRRISSKEWRLHDSKILAGDCKVGNELKKGWFFNLTYKQPRKDLGLNKENVAILYSNPKGSRRAFQISHGETVWQIGNNAYKNQIKRLMIRRKAIRYRYKTDSGKGHGNAKFYSALRPHSRSVRDAQTRFQWLAIKDVVAFCVKNNVGKLIYREPSLGLRNFNTWFSQHGLPFAWDRHLQRLAHKCHIYGIELVVDRIKKVEYDTIFVPEATRNTEPPANTHVKTMVFEGGKGPHGHQAAPLATGKIRRRPARG